MPHPAEIRRRTSLSNGAVPSRHRRPGRRGPARELPGDAGRQRPRCHLVSAATAAPLALGSFTVLDPGTPPGRPDPEGTGERALRGFIVAWAVNEAGHEIRWNHLTGAATIVHSGLRTA